MARQLHKNKLQMWVCRLSPIVYEPETMVNDMF